MERNTKRSLAKSLPVFNEAYINYIEVAAILIDKLNFFCEQAPETAFNLYADTAVDPVEMAADIELCFDHLTIHELMASELGQGIMLGLFLSKAHIAEAAALEEGAEASED
jgi:hypothetical protein